MKNSMLPPPISKSLNYYSQTYKKFGRVLLSFTLLLFLTLTPYNKINGQCNSNNFLYETCNTTYLLTSPQTSGWDYYWYECDVNGSNGVLVSGGSTLGTFTAYSAGSTLQTHYYYYYAEDHNNAANNCTSGIFLVVFDLMVGINSTNSTSLPTTLSMQTVSSVNTYSSYQWYLDGSAIASANSNTYYATLPGEYYFTAVGNICGSTISSTYTTDCGTSTYGANYIFPPGTTTITGGTIILDGMTTIPEGAIVNISGTTIIMQQNSGIEIENNTNNSLVNGGVLNITSCTISSCGDWQGIFVRGSDPLISQTSASGKLYMHSSSINDANIAIYADNNARLDIASTDFENNYSHVQLNYFSGLNSSHGVEIDFNNCNFNALMSGSPRSGLPGYVVAVSNSSYRPMVYIYDSKTISFTSCNFNCTNYASPKDQIGLDIISVTGAASGVQGLTVSSCTFDGEFNTAVYIEDGQDVSIGGSSTGNTITGDYLNGISVLRGQDVAVNYNTIHYTGGSIGNTGLKMDQTIESSSSTVYGNYFQKFTNGMELYFDRSTGTYTHTIINYNRFLDNTFGLVYAPVCYPINNSSSCNTNHTTATGSSVFNLYCNKFILNGFGVVGIGDMNQQGTVGFAIQDWGSFFTSSGSSTSTDADVAWSLNTVDIVSQAGLYFKTTSAISIDGTNIDYLTSTIFNHVGGSNGCYQNFKTDPSTNISNIDKQNKVNDLRPKPNPFDSYLYIENSQSQTCDIDIYNIHGQLIANYKHLYGTNIKIPTDNITAGCYILKATNSSNQEILGQWKMLKLTN